jgi:hypothetical protein
MLETVIKAAKQLRAADPFLKLREIMPGLIQLRYDLMAIRERYPVFHDDLDALVAFFALTSPWHDRGLQDVIQTFEAANFRNRYARMVEYLERLAGQFQKSGRSPYGINRTAKGQPMTAERIYLGDIYGLFTQSISFWRDQKGAPKGGWGYPGMDDLNPYDVVSRQAREFMKPHLERICGLITSIEAESEAHFSA